MSPLPRRRPAAQQPPPPAFSQTLRETLADKDETIATLRQARANLL